MLSLPRWARWLSTPQAVNVRPITISRKFVLWLLKSFCMLMQRNADMRSVCSSCQAGKSYECQVALQRSSLNGPVWSCQDRLGALESLAQSLRIILSCQGNSQNAYVEKSRLSLAASCGNVGVTHATSQTEHAAFSCISQQRNRWL